jgi:hypothetical protein
MPISRFEREILASGREAGLLPQFFSDGCR